MSQQQYTPLSGGLDLITPPTQVDPGRAILALNYECPVEGGYRSISGYTRLGEGVPGRGQILGVAVWQGDFYSIREQESGGTAALYQWNSSTGVWDQLGTGMAAGRYEFTIGNFYATAASEALYMVCPNGKPYEWNGATLTELAAAQSGAAHIIAHDNRLILGFEAGTIQISEAGSPEGWDGTLGAAEIGASDRVTGLASLSGGVLAIFCADSIKVLYGTSVDDWELKVLSANAGAKRYSIASMAQPLFIGDQGPTSLEATQAFGDFSVAAWGRMVSPLFSSGYQPVASCVSKKHNQYRVWDVSGRGIRATFSGNELAGITLTEFPHVLKCVAQGEDSSNNELVIFGDDSGHVYQMDSGTAFHDQPIESILTLQSNHCGSPSVRKRFRRVFLETTGVDTTDLSVLPGFDYGDDDISRHLRIVGIMAAGGFFDFSEWGDFAWSAPYQSNTPISIAGSGENMNLSLHHSSSTAAAHSIRGYMLHYDSRRQMRG